MLAIARPADSSEDMCFTGADTTPALGDNDKGERIRQILLTVCVCLTVTGNAVVAGAIPFTDVSVTVVKDKVIALMAQGGTVEIGVEPGETVTITLSNGQTALVITSRRLLGFSLALRRWEEQSLDTYERIQAHKVQPQLIVVQTDRHLYGFQETRGHWRTEDLGLNETIAQSVGGGHLLAIITNERAVGFSAFTGGFFSIGLSGDETVLAAEHTADAIILRTTNRTLALRSQMNTWNEIN